MGWGPLQLISLAESCLRPDSKGKKARIWMSECLGFGVPLWLFNRILFLPIVEVENGSLQDEFPSQRATWQFHDYGRKSSPVQNPYAILTKCSFPIPPNEELRTRVLIWTFASIQGNSRDHIYHRNCTMGPRVPNLSHAGHLGGSVLEALRSSQTSFQCEVVIRSSLRPFTRRFCEISEFQIRISTWKYQSIMGQLGALLYNSSWLEQCIMWQDGKTAKIQVVWHFILSRQTLGHGNG